MEKLHKRLESNLAWYYKWHQTANKNTVHYIVLIVAFIFSVGIVISSSHTFAAGNTYYVDTAGNDSNSGAQSSPWKTLAKACNSVSGSGDIIHVNAGTYIESEACLLHTGVSIEGNGNNSILKSNLSSDWTAMIELTSNAEGTNGNQHISNLKIDGQNLHTFWGIQVAGRSNVSIYNTTIQDFKDRGVLFGGRIDTGDGAPNIYATGNSFHDNIMTNSARYVNNQYGAGALNIGGQDGMLIYNNTITQDSRPQGQNGWPIKYWNDGYLKGVKIYNNTLNKIMNGAPEGNNNWDFAIELFNVQGLEIYNNTMNGGGIDLNYQDKGSYAFSTWIHHNLIQMPYINNYIQTAVTLEFQTDTAIVEDNVFDKITTGVLYTPRDNSVIKNNIIRRNLIKNIGMGEGTGFFINFGGDGHTNVTYNGLSVYNNTMIMSPSNQTWWGIQLPSIDSGSISNVNIKNNIINGAMGAPITQYSSVGITNLNISNNDMYGNGNDNAPLLANAPAPVNYTYANNLININPAFANTSTYSLSASSPLIDSGINVGLPFSGSAPDIGYLETGSTPPPSDTTPPTVVSVTPTNNSTGVPVTIKPVVTFSEPLNSSTVTTSSVQIKQGSNIISSTSTYSNNKITITPLSSLSAGVTYSVTLTTAITDIAGNHLASNYTYNFTTLISSNLPPVANAGADQTITLPTNSASLSGSLSSDPENGPLTYLWTKISGGSGSMTTPNNVGTGVTGLSQGSYTFQLKVTDNGGLFATDTVTITVNNGPDTTSPLVLITNPTNGQTISQNKVIIVNVSDNIGVDHVDFYRNPTTGNPVLLGSGNPASNYSYSWNTTTVSNGIHLLTAKAYDAAGNSTISTPVSVIVSNTVSPGPDTIPPVVAITSPSSGQTLSSVVTLAASATDNIGVTKVNFYKNNTLIDTDTTAPWAITWNTTTVSNGAYSLTAKAYDAAGNIGNASAVSATVHNGVVLPSKVTYTTWNPSDKGSKVSLSNGNLTASWNRGIGVVRSKIGKSSGKWYWEVKLDKSGDQFVGVATSSANLNRILGEDSSGWSMVMDDGVKFHVGNQGYYGTEGHNGDVIGVALDMDSKTISFYKNCSSLGTAFTGLSGTIYPAWGSQYQDSDGTANFGARPFMCSVPSGFNSGLY